MIPVFHRHQAHTCIQVETPTHIKINFGVLVGVGQDNKPRCVPVDPRILTHRFRWSSRPAWATNQGLCLKKNLYIYDEETFKFYKAQKNTYPPPTLLRTLPRALLL